MQDTNEHNLIQGFGQVTVNGATINGISAAVYITGVSPGSSSPSPSPAGHLSQGDTAGIVISAIVGGIVIIAGAVWAFLRWRRHRAGRALDGFQVSLRDGGWRIHD